MLKTFSAQVQQRADSHMAQGGRAFGKAGNSMKGTDAGVAEKELGACQQAASREAGIISIVRPHFCRAEIIFSSQKNSRVVYFNVCFLGNNV